MTPKCGWRRGAQEKSSLERKRKGRPQWRTPLQPKQKTGNSLGTIRLLGAAAEEVEDDAGGNPIVVLVHVGAEGGAVVIDID